MGRLVPTRFCRATLYVPGKTGRGGSAGPTLGRMGLVGDMLACPPTASRDVTMSHSRKTVMGDCSSINKTRSTNAYPALETTENSCMSLLKKRNNARKMFLIPYWHWVYGSPGIMGVLCLVMSMAQLQAVKPSNPANILASQAGKSAPGYNQLGSQISQLRAAELSKYSHVCCCWSCPLLSRCPLVLYCLKSPLLIQWWFVYFYFQLTNYRSLFRVWFSANNGPMSAQILSPCKWAVRLLEWTGNGDGPGYRW